jgi:hypothetical protein
MRTATTAKEDSSSKMVQNYPHEFTKRHYFFNVEIIFGADGGAARPETDQRDLTG